MTKMLTRRHRQLLHRPLPPLALAHRPSPPGGLFAADAREVGKHHAELRELRVFASLDTRKRTVVHPRRADEGRLRDLQLMQAADHHQRQLPAQL